VDEPRPGRARAPRRAQRRGDGPPAAVAAPAGRPRSRDRPGAQHDRAQPAPDRRPLRPRQRPLLAVPRRAVDVLVGDLPQRGRDARGGLAAQDRDDLPQARAAAFGPPVGDRDRLGLARPTRRGRVRLPRDDGDDLARAARSRRREGAGGWSGGSGRRAAARLPRAARQVRQAGVDRDDRGGRVEGLRDLLRVLQRSARAKRPDAAAGDHHERWRLRRREGQPQLHRHLHLPRRLPAFLEGDRPLRRAAHRHARDRRAGHHRALRGDAAPLARALRRPPPRARRPGLRRALRAAMGALPRLLRGRLPRAPHPRCAGLAGQASVARRGSGDRRPRRRAAEWPRPQAHPPSLPWPRGAGGARGERAGRRRRGGTTSTTTTSARSPPAAAGTSRGRSGRCRGRPTPWSGSRVR
jgi:hypothetical protein